MTVKYGEDDVPALYETWLEGNTSDYFEIFYEGQLVAFVTKKQVKRTENKSPFFEFDLTDT